MNRWAIFGCPLRGLQKTMNNDNAQAIIAIVILLFVFAIILTPIIALWVYIILQNGKRKRIRERILAARSDVIGKKRWFPARYAGQQRSEERRVGKECRYRW